MIYPMKFEDSIDTVLATSFLQDLAEARRTASLYAASCTWSSTPAELDNANAESFHSPKTCRRQKAR